MHKQEDMFITIQHSLYHCRPLHEISIDLGDQEREPGRGVYCDGGHLLARFEDPTVPNLEILRFSYPFAKDEAQGREGVRLHCSQ